MKKRSTRLLLAGIILAVGLSACAQSINIIDANSVQMPNGNTDYNFFPFTWYSDLQVFHSESVPYYVTNDQHGSSLLVSSVTITGPDASQFSIGPKALPPLGSNADTNLGYFTVIFHPTTSGPRYATVNVVSNDSHGNGNYTFAVTALALDNAPTPLPDLVVSASSTPKSKVKKGAYEVSGKALVTNVSATQMDRGYVDIFVSPHPYAAQDALYAQRILLKKMKGVTSNKLKSVKVSYKFNTQMEFGYVFILAAPTTPNRDANWLGNGVVTGFASPFK